NERPNTPSLEMPPNVPYRVLPDKIRPSGIAPSSTLKPLKLCRVVKFEPSVLTANTMPKGETRSFPAVPYRVLPDNIKPPNSMKPPGTIRGKLYSVVKPVPSVLTLNTVSSPPYRVLPDKINSVPGPTPSLPPVKLCRFVNPEPSVLTANTVPNPKLPP